MDVREIKQICTAILLFIIIIKLHCFEIFPFLLQFTIFEVLFVQSSIKLYAIALILLLGIEMVPYKSSKKKY